MKKLHSVIAPLEIIKQPVTKIGFPKLMKYITRIQGRNSFRQTVFSNKMLCQIYQSSIEPSRCNCLTHQFTERSSRSEQFQGKSICPIFDVNHDVSRKALVRTLHYMTHNTEMDSAEHSMHSFRTCRDRKSTRLNSSHLVISYAVFCLKKKKKHTLQP